MKLQKHFVVGTAAVLLVMGLCGCTGNQPDVTLPQPSETVLSVVTVPETTASAQTDSPLADLLDSVRADIQTGTAGSSLRAVPYAVQLLQWATDSALTPDEIQAQVADYLQLLGNDAKEEFVQQMELVYNMALELLGPRSADVYESAGVSPVTFASKTLEVLNPLMVALGTEESQLKPAWQVDFEKSLFENYDQIPSRYEALENGSYQVYVWIDEQEVPYVVVDSETGDYHG